MGGKKIVYIDMDGVMCDFYGAKNKALELNPEFKYPQSQYSFYLNLKPIYMAKFMWSWFLESDKYDPYILTAPSVKNPLSYTEKRLWVEKHLGLESVDRLIISPRKDLNVGDYLIDDNTSGRGQENFKGVLIHYGSDLFKSWLPIFKYFKENKRK